MNKNSVNYALMHYKVHRHSYKCLLPYLVTEATEFSVATQTFCARGGDTRNGRLIPIDSWNIAAVNN